MDIKIEKLELTLQPSDKSVANFKLTQKGEEQEDGSLLVRLCAVHESGKLIPLRWHGDVELDELS